MGIMVNDKLNVSLQDLQTQAAIAERHQTLPAFVQLMFQCVESAINEINTLHVELKTAHAHIEKLKTLRYELMGIESDMEHDNTFDNTCMQTLKRVMEELESPVDTSSLQRIIDFAQEEVGLMKENCAKVCEIDAQSLLLQIGEMTAAELLKSMTVLKNRASTIRALPGEPIKWTTEQVAAIRSEGEWLYKKIDTRTSDFQDCKEEQ